MSRDAAGGPGQGSDRQFLSQVGLVRKGWVGQEKYFTGQTGQTCWSAFYDIAFQRKKLESKYDLLI